MLKIYHINSYISIDGSDWRQVGHSGYRVGDENTPDVICVDNLSFDEAREHLSFVPCETVSDVLAAALTKF